MGWMLCLWWDQVLALSCLYEMEKREAIGRAKGLVYILQSCHRLEGLSLCGTDPPHPGHGRPRRFRDGDECHCRCSMEQTAFVMIK